MHIAQASKVLPCEGTKYARLSDVLQHFKGPPPVLGNVAFQHRLKCRRRRGAQHIVCWHAQAQAQFALGGRQRHAETQAWIGIVGGTPRDDGRAALRKPVGQARLMRGDVRLPAGVR